VRIPPAVSLTGLGFVVGTAGGMSAALGMVRAAHTGLAGTILDVNLGGQRVYPVASC
jgi:hypothetical protein